jgi:hypothetical protein
MRSLLTLSVIIDRDAGDITIEKQKVAARAISKNGLLFLRLLSFLPYDAVTNRGTSDLRMSVFLVSPCKFEGDTFASQLSWSSCDPIAAVASYSIDSDDRETYQVLFVNNEVFPSI